MIGAPAGQPLQFHAIGPPTSVEAPDLLRHCRKPLVLSSPNLARCLSRHRSRRPLSTPCLMLAIIDPLNSIVSRNLCHASSFPASPLAFCRSKAPVIVQFRRIGSSDRPTVRSLPWQIHLLAIFSENYRTGGTRHRKSTAREVVSNFPAVIGLLLILA